MLIPKPDQNIRKNYRPTSVRNTAVWNIYLTFVSPSLHNQWKIHSLTKASLLKATGCWRNPHICASTGGWNVILGGRGTEVIVERGLQFGSIDGNSRAQRQRTQKQQERLYAWLEWTNQPGTQGHKLTGQCQQWGLGPQINSHWGAHIHITSHSQWQSLQTL